MQRDAMGEDRDGEALDVVGGYECATFEEGECLGGAVERLRATGADAERERVVCASLFDNGEKVVDERVVDDDVLDGLL